MQETQETWVLSLGWEDPLKQEMANHPSILAWKMCYSSGGRKELDMTDHERTTITTKRKSLLLLLAMLTELTVEDEGYFFTW